MNAQIEYESQRLATVKNRVVNDTNLNNITKTSLIKNLEGIQQMLNEIKERGEYCQKHNMIPDYYSKLEEAKTKITIANLSLIKL